MRQLLTTLIDILFPPTKTEQLLRSATPDDIHKHYSPSKHRGVTYLCGYNQSLIQAAILENKFNHHRLAARLLSQPIDRWVQKNISSTLFVPIPLGKHRQRQRGHNQVESILRASSLPLSISTTLLQRVVETPPQTTLNKQLRLQNMKQAFQYTGNKTLGDSITHVVIIDDVVTTGATLAAARATLAPHLPQHITLSCLAIAH